MGKQFTLTTTDKHSLGAYRADPAGTPKGGMVVVQEIFGVNHHIRAVCDRLAALGYVAVAPAVFDRFVRDFESGYTPDEIAHARSYLGNLNWDHMMADVRRRRRAISRASGPLGIVGFCMGGTAAFLAACRLPGFSAAVAFYGGMIGKFADEKPKCPMQMHFGEKDDGIPMDVVDEHQGEAAAGGNLHLSRMRRTASIATSARAIARKPATSPGSARRNFSAKHMKKCSCNARSKRHGRARPGHPRFASDPRLSGMPAA